MSALDYSAVSKTFASTVALEHFDLGVRDGELISLLGPSGCGKTTALRIAAGFEHPDGGAVRVDGADITRTPAHKRNMGMVFQSYSLFPNLNVESNVAFGLRVRKVSGSERSRRIAEALERVQLSAFAKRYPHQLSGGQQQRVALARALVVEPAVLLLDEPLSALDAKVRTTLREEIRRLQQDVGITTLFVTHDQDEALAISDRVGVMSHGRLEQLGTPREVYSNPASAFVARFVGQINELAGTSNGNGIAVGDRNLPIAPPSGGRVGRRSHRADPPRGRRARGARRSVVTGRSARHGRRRGLRWLVEHGVGASRPARHARQRRRCAEQRPPAGSACRRGAGRHACTRRDVGGRSRRLTSGRAPSLYEAGPLSNGADHGPCESRSAACRSPGPCRGRPAAPRRRLAGA